MVGSVVGSIVESGFQALGLTFALALTSATAFLVLRCHEEGRPFGGRHSRRWAAAAILHTSVLSTVAAFIGVVLLRYVPPAVLSVVAPSGLWFSHLRRDRAERQHHAHSLGLTWILRRLHQTMAEDRLSWCDERIDLDWRPDQLAQAALSYYEYLKERLEPADRRRAQLDRRRKEVEERLEVVRLIESGASAAKVRAAMRGSRFTQAQKYATFPPDSLQLSDRLRHDAEQALKAMLAWAYKCGCYNLPVFVPSGRVPWREPEVPERPHP